MTIFLPRGPNSRVEAYAMLAQHALTSLWMSSDFQPRNDGDDLWGSAGPTGCEPSDHRDRVRMTYDQALFNQLPQIVQVVEEGRQVLNAVSAQELGEWYDKHANEENTKARLWLSATVGVLVVSITYAVMVAQFGRAPLSSREIAQLSVTIPLILFAVYCSRQAHFHRTECAQSRRSAVQVKTAPAFTQALSEAQRQQVLTALGMSLFASPMAGVDAAGSQYGMLAEAVDLLRAAVGKMKPDK
ncbi:hypothetical protein [Dactylosporangium sp. CA-092794]|uniref:hypothetical protein n=1 Tax=Dactylosporangium sp. CA-092794 TaxID=3239929 RepID=UPI003D8D5139